MNAAVTWYGTRRQVRIGTVRQATTVVVTPFAGTCELTHKTRVDTPNVVDRPVWLAVEVDHLTGDPNT